ncbi:SH3 domain-containing kinase-binding protein 1-like isoform X2 [Pectinophora gossypiella]|uniref:SH3 domain-containing kinase-binding protein 1-like isoform X2 n=1 Tax=Pectinophora gossypiella TaxID=13191 RepID=UPI00214EB0D8|nr:SH3 domain-containing kinase-binding protein 1-like isoform X2 [Pectinophora gossypiella]
METNANQKVSCIVNYAYDASEPDELSIRPGDVVRDVERLPGGWWRGELRQRRGMFPDNFVSVLNDHATGRSSVQGRCRAVFSYQPANPDELPLCVGDVLDVLGEVEEGWWQGRRQGRVGVFPSNFVVMLDAQPAAAFEPAPALPPKPVKEQCRVLFPYTAVNDDELTLAEGDIVSIVSKDAPDRGWWRGELHGRQGLFPDNFVQIIPAVAQDAEEKKPERPPSKTSNAVYPILNKYSEKTASVKELTTSKISLHKENTISKESSTQSTVTHTNKSESEKLIHSETVSDGTLDGQIKKPPVPLKKSPTPTSAVTGLFSGLKSKMLPNADKEKEKSPAAAASSGSSSGSGGEWDRPDGAAQARPASTFDHVERNSILNDPRAGRVKAPRRRPPSQTLRDDTPLQIGLSNGHEAEKTLTEKAEEIKPRTREWEKHRAPWMEELKLNQAKKTSFGAEGKSRSVSSDAGVAGKTTTGSTDRILDCGLEEKRSTHSMEMSKSTSSISSRISVLESFDETKVRHSLESKKDVAPPPPTSEPPSNKPTAQSPTAAGRTFTTMLDELKKPAPPAATARTHNDIDKSPHRSERTTLTAEKQSELTKLSSGVLDKTSTVERMEKTTEERSIGDKVSSLERRGHKGDRSDVEALVAQLNNRITNLEKLLEVQNAKFNAAIAELTTKLNMETEKRQALQAEVEKLAHCVTSV